MCGTEKQMRTFTGGNGDARGVLKLDVERFRQRLPMLRWLEEISSSESRERRKQENQVNVADVRNRTRRCCPGQHDDAACRRTTCRRWSNFQLPEPGLLFN
jgi:hypothetical protein